MIKRRLYFLSGARGLKGWGCGVVYVNLLHELKYSVAVWSIISTFYPFHLCIFFKNSVVVGSFFFTFNVLNLKQEML